MDHVASLASTQVAAVYILTLIDSITDQGVSDAVTQPKYVNGLLMTHTDRTSAHACYGCIVVSFLE